VLLYDATADKEPQSQTGDQAIVHVPAAMKAVE
jgi:hypothetical protein